MTIENFVYSGDLSLKQDINSPFSTIQKLRMDQDGNEFHSNE
jgi:hypothetical protein